MYTIADMAVLHDAERTLLGLLMLDNTILRKLDGRIGRDTFESESHQLIFDCIFELDSDDIAVDMITVKERLELTHDLESVGGDCYLFDLTKDAPSSLEARDIEALVCLLEETAAEKLNLGDNLCTH